MNVRKGEDTHIWRKLYIALCGELALEQAFGPVVRQTTYLLAPWSRVLLEKLTGFQLVKKFPAFYGTPKAHYRIHKCPPSVSILSQPNPVHTPTFHFLIIHPYMILPSMPGSPQWSLSLRFSHQNHIHASLLPYPGYIPRLYHYY
jgi:hypothetical protein